MTDERNQNQITRKDAKNCFVESLNDVFAIGKIHLNFSAYDPNKPAGQRQMQGYISSSLQMSLWNFAVRFPAVSSNLCGSRKRRTMTENRSTRALAESLSSRWNESVAHL